MEILMNMVRRTLSFFLPAERINDTDLNRRTHTRLPASGITATIQGNHFDVVNLGQGGLLLKADNSNAPDLNNLLDLTLNFVPDSGDMLRLNHHGQVIRRDKRGVVVALRPLEKFAKTQFNHIVDAMLTEDFIGSQVA